MGTGADKEAQPHYRLSQGVWGLVLQATKVTSVVTLLQGDMQLSVALRKGFTLAPRHLSNLCPSLLFLLSSALFIFQTGVHERRGMPPSNPDMKEMI